MEDPFQTQCLQLSILLHCGASAILQSLGKLTRHNKKIKLLYEQEKSEDNLRP